MWRCGECGFEDETRWLMCPECTTPEEWSQAIEETRMFTRPQPPPPRLARICTVLEDVLTVMQ